MDVNKRKDKKKRRNGTLEGLRTKIVKAIESWQGRVMAVVTANERNIELIGPIGKKNLGSTS